LGPGGDRGITISEFVSISGEWVRDRLQPRIDITPGEKTLGLPILFGSGAGTDHTIMTAEIFLWLKKKSGSKLSLLSFPEDLLDAAYNTRARAAAKSQYAYQPDGVTLMVACPDGTNYRIDRFHGGVIVNGGE
jgi:hypothetical protein